MNKLLHDFCVRHALPLPEPDDQGHYHLGFDHIEVSLFEDLGKLYLMAEVVQLPDKIEERERTIEKSCAYLFPNLYIDDCLLNLYNNGSGESIMLVAVMDDPDELDIFESRLAALVNRAERLIVHLKKPSRTGVENRLAVFRP